MVVGFIGVVLGVEVFRWFKRINLWVDFFVCVFGLLMCILFLFFGFWILESNILVFWVSIILYKIYFLGM